MAATAAGAAPWFAVSPNALLSAAGRLHGPDPTVPTPAEDWRHAVVDVVIPVDRQQHTIVHCLASLLRQTRLPRQVVLVDDGGISRDHSAQLAREFARANGFQLKVVVRTWSIGAVATIKRQAREFTGDVVVVLNGATVLESPDYLERCVRELYQGVGIASACGLVLPLRPAQRREIAATPGFLRWLGSDHDAYRDPLIARDWLHRLWRWFGDSYRESVALYQQRFINRGLMDRFGSIGHPFGCAVAYRRRYLKDLFDRYEPIRGDDLTGAEDIFIGLALATEGYRNIQLADVVARTAQPGLHKLPAQAHRWSTAFLQVGHYFDALLRTPLKWPRRCWRRLHERRRGAPAWTEQRKIREAYRQPFGERLTQLQGRPIGHALLLQAIERIGYPVALLLLALLGLWTALGVVVAVEVTLALALLVTLAPQRRWAVFGQGLLATPLRYALMLAELFTLLHFAGQLWITGQRRWHTRRHL